MCAVAEDNVYEHWTSICWTDF